MTDAERARAHRAVHRAELERRAAPVLARLKASMVPERKLTEMRAACRRGVCPLCGTSELRSVIAHVVQVHGLDAREFRDMVGATYSESICSPEHSRACADRARARDDRPYQYRRPSGPRQVSRAGKRQMRLNGLLGLPQIPAEVKRAIRSGRVEAV